MKEKELVYSPNNSLDSSMAFSTASGEPNENLGAVFLTELLSVIESTPSLLTRQQLESLIEQFNDAHSFPSQLQAEDVLNEVTSRIYLAYDPGNMNPESLTRAYYALQRILKNR